MSTISVGNTITTSFVTTGDTTGNLTFSTVGGVVNTASMVGAIAVPSGTTDQRPVNLANGMIRYNSNTSKIEVLTNGSWTSLT